MTSEPTAANIACPNMGLRREEQRKGPLKKKKTLMDAKDKQPPAWWELQLKLGVEKFGLWGFWGSGF